MTSRIRFGRSLIVAVVSFLSMLMGTAQNVYGDLNNPNTDWLRDAKYGIFSHYLYNFNEDLSNISNWSAFVDDFDVNAFANYAEQAGARYVIFTLGQGWGRYCSPNAKFDQLLANIGQPARSPARDLPNELYTALNAKGIKLILYMVGDPSGADSIGRQAMGWDGQWDYPNDPFRNNVYDMIKEWSDRYGTKVAGWWIDGMGGGYNSDNLAAMVANCKSGNANAIVALNPFGFVKMTNAQDYTSGELNELVGIPASRWFSGIQWHLLSFLGYHWNDRTGRTKYSTEQLIDLITTANSKAGVVTMDASINRYGTINNGPFNQLKAVNKAVRTGGTGNIIVNDDDSTISYVGTWSLSSNRASGNFASSNPIPTANDWINNSYDYNNDVHFSSASSDYAQYTFYGTGVDFVTELAPDEGTVDVYLDGIFQQTVNCYAASKAFLQSVYSVSNLPAGKHTIRVVKTGGTYLVVDAFKVRTTINNTASPISYSGSWSVSSGRGALDFGDDVSHTASNGNFFQYTFNGTGIDYITENANDMGTVDIYVDNIFQQTVNCYTAGARSAQVVAYAKRSLTPGSHTLKIVKTGGSYMLLDALKVYNIVNNADSGFTYSGSWNLSSNRGPHDYNQDVQYTATNGDYVSYSFTGTGVEYLTENADDLGNVDIYIDNVYQTTVNCFSTGGTEGQRVMYSNKALASGTHTFKAVKTSGNYMLVDALRIYN